MAKINNFTLEEIQNFWYNATTKREFAEFLGYKSASHVFELQKKFNLLTEDLGKNNPNMKRYMIDPSGSKREDLTGKQFGKWTVIELDWEKTEFDSQHSWWKCQCSCENHTIKSVTMNNLKRGKSQSCGCQATSIPIENMIGKKFGKLTPYAIDASIHSRRGIYLKCRCDCGNEISCCSVDLRNGHTKSCGCLQLESLLTHHPNLIDLTGQVYNYLQVVALDEEKTKEKGTAYWRCKCLKCNSNILKSVKASHLKNGSIKSCGCLKSSFEEKIVQILNDNDIYFQREYHFNDLYGDKKKLSFDFAIFDYNSELKYLIEYQGEQHYKAVKAWGGQEGLEKRQRYDELKKKYCEEHHIPLVLLNKDTPLNEDNIIKKELL